MFNRIFGYPAFGHGYWARKLLAYNEENGLNTPDVVARARDLLLEFGVRLERREVFGSDGELPTYERVNQIAHKLYNLLDDDGISERERASARLAAGMMAAQAAILQSKQTAVRSKYFAAFSNALEPITFNGPE